MNAVLGAPSPPIETFYFVAQFDGQSCRGGAPSGSTACSGLSLILRPTPSTPAPAPGWTFIREGAVLYSVLTWTKTAQTFDFLLPPSSALPEFAGQVRRTDPRRAIRTRRAGSMPPASPLARYGRIDGARDRTDLRPVQFSEQLNPFVLLDLSTNVDQFGVAFGGYYTHAGPRLAVGETCVCSSRRTA